MKNVLVLLGGNKLNYGVFDKYHKLGYKVCVVDWNENPYIKGDIHYQIDVKDCERVLYELSKDDYLDNVFLAYTSIDKAIETVVEINRSNGYKVASKKALKNVASKSAMTSIWEKRGLLNRFSNVYECFSRNIIDTNKKNDLIIKPDDSASSRGVTVVMRGTSESELRKAYERAYEEGSNGKVVVEEYVEGNEYTAELVGDDYGNVSVMAISKKKHTNHAGNNRISVRLHYNCVANQMCASIAQVAIECYKALNLSCSMGHLELIVKNDGTISPIEIGARSSGYIASSLVDVVSGVDYIGKLRASMQGGRVENGYVKQTNKSAVFYFYDFPQGQKIVKECNIIDFMDERVMSLYNDRSRIKVGAEFGIIKSDNDRHGYEVLAGPRDILTPTYLNACEKDFMKSVGMY